MNPPNPGKPRPATTGGGTEDLNTAPKYSSRARWSTPLAARGTPGLEKPFTWASKAALWRICEGQVKNVSLTLATYLGLAWLSSDAAGQSFTATKSQIAARAGGIGRRTVEYALADLEGLGLVAVERRRLVGRSGHEVNRYTLTSTVAHGVRKGGARGAGPSRTGRRASGAGYSKRTPELRSGEKGIKKATPPSPTRPAADAGALPGGAGTAAATGAGDGDGLAAILNWGEER